MDGMDEKKRKRVGFDACSEWHPVLVLRLTAATADTNTTALPSGTCSMRDEKEEERRFEG